MFKKLRNKLILINMGITSIVILTAFSTIYVVSTRTANERRPAPGFTIETTDGAVETFTENFREYLSMTVREEQNAAASNLLTTLVISGVAIEIAVLLVSYFLAEEAIKPVKDAYEAQKIFIANASHEIKTPLAAISANLEAADIADNKWIKNVELETAKLTALNSELLTLARTDLVAKTTSTEVNLKAEVEASLESTKPRLRQDQRLVTKISLPPKLKINSADFLQIFNILLDNAVKYSDQFIKISLTAHKLSVENDGNIIPKENLNRIFDRFYQVDKNKEGVGLGLSIAKSLADRNKWSLIVESDKTTTFALEF